MKRPRLAARSVYVIEMLPEDSEKWFPTPGYAGLGVLAYRLRKEAVEALADKSYGNHEAACPPVVFGQRVRYRIRRYVRP